MWYSSTTAHLPHPPSSSHSTRRHRAGTILFCPVTAAAPHWLGPGLGPAALVAAVVYDLSIVSFCCFTVSLVSVCRGGLTRGARCGGRQVSQDPASQPGLPTRLNTGQKHRQETNQITKTLLPQSSDTQVQVVIG